MFIILYSCVSIFKFFLIVMWIKYFECNIYGKIENINFNDSISVIISICMNCIVLKKLFKYIYFVKIYIFFEKIDIFFIDINIF